MDEPSLWHRAILERMEEFMSFLRSENVWVLIPVVAIVGGITHSIITSMHRHQERLAMIEKGMNPDAGTGKRSES